MRRFCVLAAAVLMIFAGNVMGDLVVQRVEELPRGRALIRSERQNHGGVTSMRFQSNKSEKQTAGITYFTRDRDLGQTFTTLHTTSRLDAITIRTGPVPGSVKPGARGARISLQFFEVTGEARILDNGTTTANSNQAGNQWTQDPRADDIIVGEEYRPLFVARGGVLPRDLETNQFLRFDLTGEHEIELKPQTRYAFLLLFDEIGEDRSLSLANEYWGQYSGGHGIRREGTAREPWWENNAFPTNFTQRVAQPPATFGRPDVDTWRDLVFAVETQPVETASVEELKLVPFYALPNGKWVTEPHLPAGHTSPPAFKAIVSEIWPAGLVPLFAFQKETRMELRRLPARGEENVSEPAFFALPPLDEPDAGLIAGRWDCDATNHQGQVHQPNWELAVNDGKLSGRFDPHGEYRVAFITDGFFRTNTFQMITEFSNDRFILDAQMRDGALVGTYRQQDDSDHGTWVARRRGGVAVPSPMGAVPLYEWRKGDSIRYGITPPEKNSGWQRAARPLGRVWQ